MSINKFALLLLVYCLLSCCKQPNPPDQNHLNSIPDPKTQNESYVSDPDHLLSNSTISSLNARLAPVDHAGVAHIDVVFVASIGARVPKDLAHALFRKWKVGDQKKNNGLLILIVKDQRRVEFETGYGLEGPLPDVVCYRIQQEYIVPYAKEGNYDFAILSAVDAVISQLKREGYGASPSGAVPDTVADTLDSTLSPAVPGNIVAPIIEAPEIRSDQTFQGPSASANPFRAWPSLIILLIYIFAAFIISRSMNADGQIKLANPFLWLMLVVPVSSIMLLDLYIPVGWKEIRQVVMLYLSLTSLIQVYYWILSRKIFNSLKGKSSHEQYIQWYNSHARMKWAIVVFPLFRLYWIGYQKRLKILRDTPPFCNSCKKIMIRITEDQEDSYLSQGQRAEERVKSIEYDVWECRGCKKKVVLDYSDLRSKAKTCPKCNHRTLLYQKKVIVESATTSNAGSGYKLSFCETCYFEAKEHFSIPRISSSSSISSISSSSSSSSPSTSSGGSSGGGGAGSTW